MTMANCEAADPPLASVTPTEKANCPAVFGVPEMAPPEASVTPSGRFPPVRAKRYGAVPPVATIRPAYATPTTPVGTLLEEEDMETTAGPTKNGSVPEDEPPGLNTCTLTWPAAASRLAGTVVVKVVLLTKVVANVVPRNEMYEPDRKLAPATVSPQAGEPAGMEVSESAEMAGANTENVTVLETPGPCVAVPGLSTCTVYWVGETSREAGTSAVSVVLLTNVVATPMVFR